MTPNKCYKLEPTNMINYDVIWYWKGDRELGEWRAATFSESGLLELERAGYIAHRGRRVIGPPEGPPSDQEFQRMGL